MTTPSTLATIVTAPYRDEATLERAAKAARFYRALADAIEADPRLAPGLDLTINEPTVSATFYAGYGHGAEFLAAARAFGKPKQDACYVSVDGEIAGVPVRFSTFKSGLPKRKVTRTVEVEEYVLDEDGAA